MGELRSRDPAMEQVGSLPLRLGEAGSTETYRFISGPLMRLLEDKCLFGPGIFASPVQWSDSLDGGVSWCCVYLEIVNGGTGLP